jgi:hypothetical protein
MLCSVNYKVIFELHEASLLEGSMVPSLASTGDRWRSERVWNIHSTGNFPARRKLGCVFLPLQKAMALESSFWLTAIVLVLFG